MRSVSLRAVANDGEGESDELWYVGSVSPCVRQFTHEHEQLARQGWFGERRDALMEARLAPDMRPFPAQYQMASDSAKNALARLTGTDAPAMPDTEASFAELADRCTKTIDHVSQFDAAALADAADREVELKFPNGMG